MREKLLAERAISEIHDWIYKPENDINNKDDIEATYLKILRSGKNNSKNKLQGSYPLYSNNQILFECLFEVCGNQIVEFDSELGLP